MAYAERDADRVEEKLERLERKAGLADEASTAYIAYILGKLVGEDTKGLLPHEAAFLKDYEKAVHPEMKPAPKGGGVTIEPQNANILIQAQKAIGDGSE